MKKIIATALSLLLALLFTGCSTKSDIESDEQITNLDLEASLASMQDEIDALNEKLEQTSSSTIPTSTTTTTTATTTTTTTVFVTTTMPSRTTSTTKPWPIMPNVIGMTVEDACKAILDAGIGYSLSGYPHDYIVTEVTPPVGAQLPPAQRTATITAAEPPNE